MAKKFLELTKWLVACGKDKVTLSFAEIENILGFELESSAYDHSSYWYPTPTHMLPKAWEEAGYFLDNLDFKGRLVTLAKTLAMTKQVTSEHVKSIPNSKPTAVRERPKILTNPEQQRQSLIPERIEKLCKDFITYIRIGEQKYDGPSVYFHLRTVDTFQKLGSSVSRAAKDQCFCELLYATLVSWGMHDLKGAKMPDFESFVNGIAKQSSNIETLSRYQITRLSEEDIPSIVNNIWKLIVALPGSVTKSKLVANSKLLHHLLPQSVPPIDRVNIGLFFGYDPADFQNNVEDKFKLIFPQMISIAQRVKSTLDSFPYAGFNSSPTKVIDNAIIGFVKEEG